MGSKSMALGDDDILANVFDFVGSGHYFFVANINSEFRDAYKHYLRRTMPSANRSLFVTTVDSIAESETRAQSALDEWSSTTRNAGHLTYFGRRNRSKKPTASQLFGSCDGFCRSAGQPSCD